MQHIIERCSEISQEIERLHQEYDKELESLCGEEILGFKISATKSRKGRIILKAFRRVDGKNCVVHIGDSPKNIEEKILEWIDKHLEIKKLLIEKKK